ncbi:hypothetical protein LUZ63_002478 [Rhynchospora breviuscula]|uniref:Histidine-containing phosphotransfer protein n=1 Tax=Rhynchospora breviuscula TaxID=2022672 RepID=A0A9Q0CYU4_9POAL|nr:hypothetical protein LUZ63_002478 [Rhynchospora breviuscula]
MADDPLKTQPTDIKAQPKEERTHLVNSMFAEYKTVATQAKQYNQVVISLYVKYAENKISELARLLNEPVINVSKVAAYVYQLNGQSSSVGAKRLGLACTKFHEAQKENDREVWMAAFFNIRREFDELHNKFQTYLQLEHQIQALRTIDDNFAAITISDHSV